MQISRVDEIISYVGTGICRPYFAKIGDTNVVLKTYNNIESNRVLANELVCYNIAKKLNLPIPDAGICIVDEKTKISKEISFSDECYGIGFYSTRINKATRATLTSNIIQNYISNKADIIRIILFDHLIYNKDRHLSNILLDMSKDKKIYIIDHSHVFNIGCLWDCYQLQRFIDEEDYKSTEILGNNKESYEKFFEAIDIDYKLLYEHSKDFQSRLNRKYFSSIVNSLPDEWGISKTDKDKLVEYLCYRLNNLDYMCNMIGSFSY